MDRERIIWAFACRSCMKDMPDKMIKQICRANKDIFIICGKQINFTKRFLNEAIKVGCMP